MMRLMGQLDIGGKRWPRQFSWDFPLIAGLSLVGAYPVDPKVGAAPGPGSIWKIPTE